MKNLELLFASRIILAIVSAIANLAIMLVITIFAVFRGLWEQSDLVANAWRNRLSFAPMDGHFRGSMYWSMRLLALLLMLVNLIVLAEGLSWFVERIFRL